MRKLVTFSVTFIFLLITGSFNTAFAQELTNYVIDPGFEMETAFTLEEGGPAWNYVVERAFLDDIYPRSGDWCGALEEIPWSRHGCRILWNWGRPEIILPYRGGEP